MIGIHGASIRLRPSLPAISFTRPIRQPTYGPGSFHADLCPIFSGLGSQFKGGILAGKQHYLAFACCHPKNNHPHTLMQGLPSKCHVVTVILGPYSHLYLKEMSPGFRKSHNNLALKCHLWRFTSAEWGPNGISRRGVKAPGLVGIGAMDDRGTDTGHKGTCLVADRNLCGERHTNV